MAIAIEWSTRGPTGTAAKYDELLAKLNVNPGGPHPGAGCLFHWVRVGPDGLHGVDVWDTQQHFDDFAANVLGPSHPQCPRVGSAGESRPGGLRHLGTR